MRDRGPRAGFRQLILGATLPGVPLYLAYGFKPPAEHDVTMPDGRTLPCIWMDKPILDPTSAGASSRHSAARNG